MSAGRFEQLAEILERAAALRGEELERFLCEACAGDEELLRAARSLAGHSVNPPTGFLEPPAAEALAAPLQQLALQLAGQRLGEFELLERIDGGSGGVVFLARQPSLGREVAIKILSPLQGETPRGLQRFRAEARNLARLRHPNIVAVLSSDEHEGLHWIAMEFVRGDPLQRWIERAKEARALRPEAPLAGVCEPRAAAQLCERLARALQHCHEHGIIHRDVKPLNIVLDLAGEPRLVDFGLAREASAGGASLAGELSGTLHYMSPEQADGARRIDARTDIYSLGVVLYEMLALRPPFDSHSAPRILYAIAHEDPPPLTRITRGAQRVPLDLAAVCHKALQKDPDARYASAAALAEDLRRFLDGRPVSAPIPTRWRRAYETVYGRRPWLLTSALVLAGATWLFFLLPSGHSSDGSDPVLANRSRNDTSESTSAASHPHGVSDAEYLKALQAYNDELMHRVPSSDGYYPRRTEHVESDPDQGPVHDSDDQQEPR